MSFLNSVMLMGNLGEKPEILKEEKSGCFARLSIATNKKYTNTKGKVVQDTQWHTVYVNNGIGKYASSYLKKGDKVLVTGELRKKEWKDKEGKTQYSSAIYAKECKLVSAKSQDDVAMPEENTDADIDVA